MCSATLHCTRTHITYTCSSATLHCTRTHITYTCSSATLHFTLHTHTYHIHMQLSNITLHTHTYHIHMQLSNFTLHTHTYHTHMQLVHLECPWARCRKSQAGRTPTPHPTAAVISQHTIWRYRVNRLPPAVHTPEGSLLLLASLAWCL